jgi:hypothetical protein
VIDVLMPYAESEGAEESRLAPRLGTLSGTRLGVVNNSWRCMDVIVDQLQARLAQDFGVDGFEQRRISAAQVLPDPEVEVLAAQCDAVVVGIGN